MFKFLKEKLTKAASIFSKKIEEEPVKKIPTGEKAPEHVRAEKKAEEIREEPPEQIEEKWEAEEPEEPEKAAEEQKEEPKKKKTLFKKFAEKITKTTISEAKFEEMFWDLEVILMENNVAMEVIEKIKEDLKKNLLSNPIDRNKVPRIVKDSLKKSVEELFLVKPFSIPKMAKEKKPYVIVFVGINGSGKTTTIAKVADLLKKNGLRSVIAASDTFRAASIEQLEKHAEKLNVKLIKHDYKADPAAVAFDAIKHAKAHNIDAVLIDTAGRMHSNVNLMDEMKKIARVSNPDLKIFVGESITGNDCVEQAKRFDEAIGIDGIILTKADVDEKGGAAISVSYVTKKPVLYLGTGQNYSDLVPFESGKIIEALGLS